jgi:hypothetical protein
VEAHSAVKHGTVCRRKARRGPRDLNGIFLTKNELFEWTFGFKCRAGFFGGCWHGETPSAGGLAARCLQTDDTTRKPAPGVAQFTFFSFHVQENVVLRQIVAAALC